MRVISQIVEIPVIDEPSTEYIENELTKLNINPLRWAVVHVGDTMYKVSVASLQK